MAFRYLLVDRGARTGRGVVEDRLRVFDAVRVRREVEDESADDATARAETTRLRESHSHAVE